MKKSFKIISAALMIAVLTLFAAVSASAYEKGDVNGDGKISSDDARLALRQAVGLENLNADEIAASDVDGEPGVTSSDARLILRVSVGLDSLTPKKEIPTDSEYEFVRSGSYYLKGRMIDGTGMVSPVEMAITPDSTYLVSDFDGVDIGMLINGKKLYMVYSEGKCYLEMSETVMKYVGLDIDELLDSSDLTFAGFGSLENADEITTENCRGFDCDVYCFNDSEGSTAKVYLYGKTLVRMATFDKNGTLIESTDVDSISGSVPQEMITPPKSYKRYSGLTGMFSFFMVLEKALG